MSVSKIRGALRAVGLAACLAVAGALASGPAAAQGTLIYGMPADHDILDPHATGGWVTYHVTYNIFESFVKEDLTEADVMTPKLVPALATSWDVSDDGLVYTFHLREGVKFHDGTDFDADAVMFNFDRFWNKESPALLRQDRGLRLRLHPVDQGGREGRRHDHQDHADPAQLRVAAHRPAELRPAAHDQPRFRGEVR